MEAETWADLRCHKCHQGLLRRLREDGSYKSGLGDFVAANGVHVCDLTYGCEGMAACTQCGAYHVICLECSHGDYAEPSFDELAAVDDAVRKVVLCQFMYCDWERREGEESCDSCAGLGPEFALLGLITCDKCCALRQEDEQNPCFAAPERKLTGDDGGFTHTWRCTKCKRRVTLTDK